VRKRKHCFGIASIALQYLIGIETCLHFVVEAGQDHHSAHIKQSDQPLKLAQCSIGDYVFWAVGESPQEKK